MNTIIVKESSIVLTFSKDDFDYIKYDPKNNQLIILDLESYRTYRKLNEVSIELIDKVK